MTQQTVTPPPVVMIMGPPGSGKGTQAQAVQERWGFERIETGALVRSLHDDPSPLARRLIGRSDAGLLSPPPLVADLVVRETARILAHGKGVVFDGSPRTLLEAERLLVELARVGVDRVLVVALDVPRPETVTRVLRRWVCEGCKLPTAVSEQISGQKQREVCRVCGGRLVRRPDDTAEVMETRWEEYTFRTLPVIQYLERRGAVAHVDGARPIPAVTADVQRILTEALQR